MTSLEEITTGDLDNAAVDVVQQVIQIGQTAIRTIRPRTIDFCVGLVTVMIKVYLDDTASEKEKIKYFGETVLSLLTLYNVDRAQKGN